MDALVRPAGASNLHEANISYFHSNQDLKFSKADVYYPYPYLKLLMMFMFFAPAMRLGFCKNFNIKPKEEKVRNRIL